MASCPAFNRTKIGSFLFWKVDEKNKEEWTTFEFIRQFDKEHPNNPEANLIGKCHFSGLRQRNAQSHRREHLVRAATYYQVIRSFSKKWDASQRLDNALNELDAVLSSVNNIITPKNVDTTVD